MSPTAAGMAATLHLVVALALFWATPSKNFEVPTETIEVTMEEPAPPKPPPQPQPQPQPQPSTTPPAAQAQSAPPPAPPAGTRRLGLPPAQAKPTVTDKTTNMPLGLPPPSERTAEPPQLAAAQPPPAKEEPKPEPPQQAAAEPPAPPPKPEPQPAPAEPAETKLPAVEMPSAPLSMQDFVRAAPPPPPQDIVRPQPRVQPIPSPQTPTVQQLRPPQLQPSPLPTNQTPQGQSQASAALVNPADAVARTRIVDDYLWQVGLKISQHRAFAAMGDEQGTVILRLSIARDGRLMDVNVARTSGSSGLDAAAQTAARQAAPYASLPAELPGNPIVFILPLNYRK
jgi:TonB family protein